MTGIEQPDLNPNVICHEGSGTIKTRHLHPRNAEAFIWTQVEIFSQLRDITVRLKKTGLSQYITAISFKYT
jgi:hypothetical protein